MLDTLAAPSNVPSKPELRLKGADVRGGKPPRVLIVCESASAKFGGEAVLPLHYFRGLKKRGVPVWLLTHARTRDELSALFPGDPTIRYVRDTMLNRAMFRLSRYLPHRLSNFTAGFVSRIGTQLAQRRLARQIVAQERIDVVHQPMPVSPREPSLLFGLGAPVVIGPMNGDMNYPSGFGRISGANEDLLIRAGRASAVAVNWLMPGKRRAALLLVANRRTRDALPAGLCPQVAELVENGVDMGLWRPPTQASGAAVEGRSTQFIYVGRLVDWKGVDLLLEAFAQAASRAPMRLLIVGDGETERSRLETLAASLGLLGDGNGAAAAVVFAGWLTQEACAHRLQEADCLVLPSLLECGGAVVLEAMAVGKPVIATAWGGPADYLDSSCGILVPPNGRDAFVSGLRDAMVRMATSPEERTRMGENGLRKVRREYDWDAKIERILGFYRSAMTSRVHPSTTP